MKKNNGNGLKIASKAFLAAGAACGIAAVFFPPIAIANAALSAIGGALELANAIKKEKLSQEKYEVSALNENKGELSKNSMENTAVLEGVSIINPDASKDNTAKFKKREEERSTINLELAN